MWGHWEKTVFPQSKSFLMIYQGQENGGLKHYDGTLPFFGKSLRRNTKCWQEFTSTSI